MEANNRVALLFFWPDLQRQIRIRASGFKTDAGKSDSYFASRPYQSQLGAWASEQSVEVKGRKYLEDAYKRVEKEFRGKEIPRPPHWGGYRLIPEYFEFWQGRAGRMHDRICWKKEDDNWKRKRLSP